MATVDGMLILAEIRQITIWTNQQNPSCLILGVWAGLFISQTN